MPIKAINKLFSTENFSSIELIKISNASAYADSLGLEVHLGHGITFDSVVPLSSIGEIKEFNIGHFIIGESIFDGFKKVIKKFKKITNG